jgi:hypothetical protein
MSVHKVAQPRRRGLIYVKFSTFFAGGEALKLALP